jgi:hypothetical protein
MKKKFEVYFSTGNKGVDEEIDEVIFLSPDLH